jgi:rSAM/selenodomain-associated transferase 1
VDHLAVFAKHWQPGAAKTRLAATIGDAAAAEFARLSLAVLLRRWPAIADRRWLVYWPEEARDAFLELAGADYSLCPQTTGDLGRRLTCFLNDAWRRGAARVVVVGSDSPTLPADYLAQAFAALRKVPVVLGPTLDGGYYLVGAAAVTPDIFDGVAWGSPAVWSQTIERLERSGLPHAVLPTWYDVDEAADLARLAGELRQPSYDGPEWDDLRRFLRAYVRQ